MPGHPLVQSSHRRHVAYRLRVFSKLQALFPSVRSSCPSTCMYIICRKVALPCRLVPTWNHHTRTWDCSARLLSRPSCWTRMKRDIHHVAERSGMTRGGSQILESQYANVLHSIFLRTVDVQMVVVSPCAASLPSAHTNIGPGSR